MEHEIKETMLVTHGNEKGETLSVLNVVVSFFDDENTETEVVLELSPEATEEEINAAVFAKGQDLYSHLLETEKMIKKAYFNRLCDSKIEEGFASSNGHFYRTNRDDQVNMIGQKDELNADETIEIVPWKTEDVGYIDHTREEWLKVYREAFSHKRNHLFRYDALKNEIDTLTTIDEVKNITW